MSSHRPVLLRVVAVLLTTSGCSHIDEPPAPLPGNVDTILDSTPPLFTQDELATFEFHTTGGFAEVTCNIDGIAEPCVSPFTTVELEGQHHITIAAAGDSTPAVFDWTVDMTPPVVTIIDAPAAVDNDPHEQFTFIADETVTFECHLDGAVSPCTSPYKFSTVSGDHLMQITATDRAGNASGPTSYSWVASIVGPDTVIDSGPTGSVTTTTASFTFDAGGNGPFTFACRVDTDPFAACTSPLTTPDLAEGQHTFQVVATDVNQLSDASPATRTWTIDLTAPDVSIFQHPSDPSNHAAASFWFSSTDPTATFQCSVDAAAFTTCVSPLTTTALAAGAHTFAVHAIDPVGHTSDDATFAWSIDLTAPTVAITAGPTGPTNVTRPMFAFTSDAPTFCRVDGDSFVACTDTFTTTQQFPGSHTFEVEAIDTAGNTATATRSFSVDITPPVIAFDQQPPATGWSVNYFDFKFHSSSDPTATFECSTNGAAFTACTSPASVTVGYGAGQTFAVRATDIAGNAATKTVTWATKVGQVLRYSYNNGSTVNTSVLGLVPALSPSGTITVPVVGGWSHTAAGSPQTHAYLNTRRALTSSPDGSYIANVWIRPLPNAAGTIWRNWATGDGIALSYANQQVTMDVHDGATTSTVVADAPNTEWYAVTVRSLGPTSGVELWLNGNLVGSAPSASGGFGDGQFQNLVVGNAAGIDLDNLELYNSAFVPALICNLATGGQHDPTTGVCNPMRPAVELAFDHGVMDTGFLHLDVAAEGTPQFPPILGHGFLPAGPTVVTGNGFVAGFAAMPKRAYTAWIVTTASSVADSIMDFTSPSCSTGAAPFRCGLRISFTPTPSPHIEVDATTSTGLFGTVDLAIAPGRHSIFVQEELSAGVTTKLEVQVDGGTFQAITLGAGNLFTAPNSQLALPSSGTISVDEIQVWPSDLLVTNPATCELGDDGELQPDDSCKLLP